MKRPPAVLFESFFEGEDNVPVAARKLVVHTHPATYELIHANMTIPCHDAFIEYKGGILLVKRDNDPARDLLWCIGGRIARNMPLLESLDLKVKKECGLQLHDHQFIGVGRAAFGTDPFGHGRGTDTINLTYFGRGSGKLRLDQLHSAPVIVTPAMYDAGVREQLHPYMQHFMDLAIPLVGK